MRIAELGFRPRDPHAALPGMIGLMIAGDELAAGRIDRMQVGTVFEDGIDAFWNITGLHLVIADGFAVAAEVKDGADFFSSDVGGDGLRDKNDGREAKDGFHGDGTNGRLTNSQASPAFRL